MAFWRWGSRLCTALAVAGLPAWGQVEPAPGQAAAVPPSSAPEYLVVVGGRVYMAADDGLHGRELWTSDGQPGHAALVEDAYPGSESSNPRSLQPWQDGIVFSAGFAPDLGRDLGRALSPTDIERVPIPSPQFNPNPDPILLGASSRWIYFTADTPRYGREIWRTDGTEAGTVIVKDVWPGPLSPSPGYQFSARCTLVGDDLYFLAYWRIVDGKGTNESGLWKTDGTEAGTVCVTPIYEQSEGLRGFRGHLYFSSSDAQHGREPWVSDGTKTGTHVFKDINPGPADSMPSQFHPFGDLLLFQASDFQSGLELWCTDGTAEGTRLLKDVNPGASRSDPYSFMTCGNRVFFTALTAGMGRELWVTDGTTEGTRLVKDLWPGPRDGNPYQLCDVDGTLFFSASDGVHGEELWRSDGTEAGTFMVRDISPGQTSAEPYFIVNLGGTALFAASDLIHGRELWRSDGTEAGTILLDDIYREPYVNPSSSPSQPTFANGKIFFVVNDIEHGAELWVSDVGSQEARLVRDIYVGQPSSSPAGLVASGGMVFFRADDGTGGPEPWRSDGTEAGTIAIRDIVPGPEGSGAKSFTAAKDGVFFVASDPGTGEELWWADANNARLVKDIAPGPASSSPRNLVFGEGCLYFCANDGVHGEELWVCGGADGNTKLVRDIVPVPFKGAALGDLRLGPDGLYFTADDRAHGRELWHSDGTAGGTRLYVDVRVGERSLAHALPAATNP